MIRHGYNNLGKHLLDLEKIWEDKRKEIVKSDANLYSISTCVHVFHVFLIKQVITCTHYSIFQYSNQSVYFLYKDVVNTCSLVDTIKQIHMGVL